MATDANILMGEIVADPTKEEKDVEQLLVGFLHSLIAEQRLGSSKEVYPPVDLRDPTAPLLTESVLNTPVSKEQK